MLVLKKYNTDIEKEWAFFIKIKSSIGGKNH